MGNTVASAVQECLGPAFGGASEQYQYQQQQQQERIQPRYVSSGMSAPLSSTPATVVPATPSRPPLVGQPAASTGAGAGAAATKPAAKPANRSLGDDDDDIFAAVGLTTDPISPRTGVVAAPPVRRPKAATGAGESAGTGVSGGKFTASRLQDGATPKKSAWGANDLMAADSPAPAKRADAANRGPVRGSLLQQQGSPDGKAAEAAAAADDIDPFDRLLDDDDDF